VFLLDEIHTPLHVMENAIPKKKLIMIIISESALSLPVNPVTQKGSAEKLFDVLFLVTRSTRFCIVALGLPFV
jgi:hypothetical protein